MVNAKGTLRQICWNQPLVEEAPVDIGCFGDMTRYQLTALQFSKHPQNCLSPHSFMSSYGMRIFRGSTKSLLECAWDRQEPLQCYSSHLMAYILPTRPVITSKLIHENLNGFMVSSPPVLSRFWLQFNGISILARRPVCVWSEPLRLDA